MSVVTETPILDYGQRQRGAWLLRHKKLVVAVVLLILLASAGWHYHAGITRYVRWRYAHWQLTRVPPTSAFASPSTAPLQRMPFFGDVPSRRTEPVLDSLRALDPRIDAMLKPPLGRSAPGQYDFISRRRRPDGAWRTVVITGLSAQLSQPFWNTRFTVIAPPGLFDGPPPLGNLYLGVGASHGGLLWGADILIAEDPADPNSFTMEFWNARNLTGQPEEHVLVARYRLRLTNEDLLAWTTELRRDEFPSPRVPTVPSGTNLRVVEQARQDAKTFFP